MEKKMRITERRLRKIIRNTILEASQLKKFDMPKQSAEESRLQDSGNFLANSFYDYLDREMKDANLDSDDYYDRIDDLNDYYQQIGYYFAIMEKHAKIKNASNDKVSKIVQTIEMYHALQGIDAIESELESGEIADKIFGDARAHDSTNLTSSKGYELVGCIQDAVDKMTMDLTGMTPDQIRQVVQKVHSIQI